jgi:Rhs element Vgr protein
MPVKSPLDIKNPTLRISVSVNGNAIKDTYPVVRVSISHAINRISSAEVVLIDGAVESGDFPISDSDDFIPGNDLEISAGYGDEALKTVFKGMIVKQAIRVRPDGDLNLVVSCKHKAVTMTFNRTEEFYSDTTDSQIISGIIGKYGLSCTVDATPSQQELVYQKLATDWDFILSRAEFYGYLTILEDDQLTIGEPKFDGAPLLRLTMGESIITFDAELNAERQTPSLEASAWDPASQALLKSSATEPTVNAQGNLDAKSLSAKLNQTALSLSSIIPMPQEELKTWADGRLLMMRMKAIKGKVSFMGNADVKVGGLVELEGVGNRFNGNAFVSAVNHVIEDGMWHTTVRFGLDDKPIHEQQDFSYPAATGQVPAIHGLQIGTVKKIFADIPAAKYKIMVNIASSAENNGDIWARISNPYATSGAGSFFLPEVGDEVVIGFLESDPRYPVVMGCLYSNSRKSALEPADNNNYIKSFTTKSMLKIGFDDEKKILTIETPGGNALTLSDDGKSIELKDQNNNVLKMTESGINLQSDKDISIKATGNITLDATGKLNLTAKQDVAVSGANINNTAQMGFVAKGNASAEISASGQTVVKGGMVMIN